MKRYSLIWIMRKSLCKPVYRSFSQGVEDLVVSDSDDDEFSDYEILSDSIDTLGKEDLGQEEVGEEDSELLKEIESERFKIHDSIGGNVNFKNFTRILKPRNLDDIQMYIETSRVQIARETLGLILKVTIHMMKRANNNESKRFKFSKTVVNFYRQILRILMKNGNDIELLDFYVMLSYFRDRRKGIKQMLIRRSEDEQLSFHIRQRAENGNYDARALIKLATTSISLNDSLYNTILQLLLHELANNSIIEDLENFFFLRFFTLIAQSDFYIENLKLFNVLLSQKAIVLSYYSRELILIYIDLLNCNFIVDDSLNHFMKELEVRIIHQYYHNDKFHFSSLYNLLSYSHKIKNEDFRKFVVEISFENFVSTDIRTFGPEIHSILCYFMQNKDREEIPRHFKEVKQVFEKEIDFLGQAPTLLKSSTLNYMIIRNNARDILVELISPICLKLLNNPDINSNFFLIYHLTFEDYKKYLEIIEVEGNFDYAQNAIHIYTTAVMFDIIPPKHIIDYLNNNPEFFYFNRSMTIMNIPLTAKNQAKAMTLLNLKTISKQSLKEVGFILKNYEDELYDIYFKQEMFFKDYEVGTDHLMSDRFIERLLMNFAVYFNKPLKPVQYHIISNVMLKNEFFQMWIAKEKNQNYFCLSAIHMLESTRDPGSNIYRSYATNVINIICNVLICRKFYYRTDLPACGKLLKRIMEITVLFQTRYVYELKRRLILRNIKVKSHFQSLYHKSLVNSKNNFNVVAHVFLYPEEYVTKKEAKFVAKKYELLWESLLTKKKHNIDTLGFFVRVLDRPDKDIIEVFNKQENLKELLANDSEYDLWRLVCIREDNLQTHELSNYIQQVYKEIGVTLKEFECPITEIS